LNFKQDHPDVQQLVVVSLEPRARKTAEGIWIFPHGEFIAKLWEGAF